MTTYEETVAKIHQLPEALLQEVNDFVDFLQMRHNKTHWQLLNYYAEAANLAESDFSDYLSNLEDYEERLARGEIHW
jgi:hypothetical protein